MIRWILIEFSSKSILRTFHCIRHIKAAVCRVTDVTGIFRIYEQTGRRHPGIPAGSIDLLRCHFRETTSFNFKGKKTCPVDVTGIFRRPDFSPSAGWHLRIDCALSFDPIKRRRTHAHSHLPFTVIRIRRTIQSTAAVSLVHDLFCSWPLIRLFSSFLMD